MRAFIVNCWEQQVNDWGISVCCSGFILETCHLSVPAAQNPLLGSSTYHSPLQRKSSEVDPPLSPEGTGCKLASSRGKNWPHRSEKKVNIRQWHPTPVLLPGNSHGWRSLVGCSPWGREESAMTGDFPFTLHFHALEKEMATHSSVLASRIPGMEEPDGLPSMGSHRVGHN